MFETFAEAHIAWFYFQKWWMSQTYEHPNGEPILFNRYKRALIRSS